MTLCQLDITGFSTHLKQFGIFLGGGGGGEGGLGYAKDQAQTTAIINIALYVQPLHPFSIPFFPSSS